MYQGINWLPACDVANTSFCYVAKPEKQLLGWLNLVIFEAPTDISQELSNRHGETLKKSYIRSDPASKSNGRNSARLSTRA